MRKVATSVLVPFSAAAMFELIDRVEDYPAFLPWCAEGVVLARDDAATLARISIDFKGVRQTFTTRNTKQRAALIELALVDGPFAALAGRWEFTPLGEAGSKVALVLDYSFKSATLETLIGPVFEHITGSLIDSFVARAESLHAASQVPT